MKRLCFDIEANGLLDEVTLVHCVVTHDIDTDEVKLYRPHEIEEALNDLAAADVLIGHNIIGYDIPALFKLYEFVYTGKLEDTLIMSRLASTNRPMHPKCPKSIWDEHNQKNKTVGPHTLMNLGFLAGVMKGDFGTDAGWETFSEDMLKYCEQDVAVNVSVYDMLTRELRGFSDYSADLEMEVAAILSQQQRTGWLFDIKKAMHLVNELNEKVVDLEDEVHKTFKPLAKMIKEIQPRKKVGGTLSSVGLKFLKEYETLIPIPDTVDGAMTVEYTSGSFTRIDWPEFNLGSRQQIVQQLEHRGWKPTLRTENGTAIVSEPVLDSIKEEFTEASLLADYFMVTKRLSMINSWVENYNDDTGRLHGYVNTLGAVTGRCTHSGPNLAQVPASKMSKETGEILWGFEGAYGADCRSLFIVPEGYKQVGCDASGLEIRCLAHYMNNAEYTDLVLNGDIHTYNQKAAGLELRAQAKTFFYAFLYGGGDLKIGSIVGGTAKHGKLLKKRFLDGIPALKALRENVLLAAERGWLKGIDGRRIRVRSPHAALNSLLQSCGAIIMKVALVIIHRDAVAQGLDFKFVGNIHDEIQAEVLEKDVDAYSEIVTAAFLKAGEELKIRILIEGEAMAGDNWAATH